MGDRASGGGDSSSEEEEEDPKWKAAIDSILATTVFATGGTTANGSSRTVSAREAEQDGDYQFKPKKLTHAQIKMQKLLDEMLEKTLEIVNDPINVPDDKPDSDSGVRLFKKSPVGIIFDRVDDIQGPRKKPRILPGKGIDGKKSKEFRKQLKSAAVDGSDILAAAKEASEKSLARLEAKDAAAKAKAKKEEERVAELKRIRGEKWLPSIAREMQ